MVEQHQTPPHLGGHLNMTNMDEPTLDYLIARYGITSMLDVGCGPGGMVEAARTRGLWAWGIDGHRTQPWVIEHDYTTGPHVWKNHVRDPDLIWSMEFVEHVESRFIGNFLATFRAGRVLFLTHALPGQGGHHHVNEQPSDYWIDILTRDGWALDQEATDYVRAHSECFFTQRTGVVFTRSA